MRLTSKVPDAYYAFAMAHKFLKEYDIRWLPVNPYEIIHKTPNWKLKYVPQLAYELNKSEEHVLNHVMRSKDGLAMFDVAKDQYNIILNPSEEISDGRRLWTTVHEIGHIYLNHLSDFKKTSITKDSLSLEEYNHLEFEADMFAGEVLASYAKLFIFDSVYIDKSFLVDMEELEKVQEKFHEESNVKTMPIDALPLSERTRNALIKNNILYVEDLEKKKKGELLLMKGVGRKAIDEIVSSLANINKSLMG